MPYSVANLSKRTIRNDVASILGDSWPLETTSGGSTTTAVFASLIGKPVAAIQNKYLLIEESTCDGQYRIASSLAPSTGTVTVNRAFTATIATTLDAHLFDISPHLYTLGLTRAIQGNYAELYKTVLHHTFIRGGDRRSIPLPRGMERVQRIVGRSSLVLRDFFDRASSVTDPGPLWTETTGSFGITGESLICISDANGDLLTPTTHPLTRDGVLEAMVRGDTTAAAYRVFSLLFRRESSAFSLGVRLLNGAVDLFRIFDSVETSLTTASLTTTEGVDYLLRVMFDGSWVSVWVDDVQMIQYELRGENLAFLGYTEDSQSSTATESFSDIAIRLDTSGSPSLAATQTRMRHFFLHKIDQVRERGGWEMSASGRMIDLSVRNRGRYAFEGEALWIDGTAELTVPAPDVTEGSLVADSTAVVEIQQTDPAYDLLVQATAYEVLKAASQLSSTNDESKLRKYAERAADQLAVVQRARQRRAMPLTMRSLV